MDEEKTGTRHERARPTRHRYTTRLDPLERFVQELTEEPPSLDKFTNDPSLNLKRTRIKIRLEEKIKRRCRRWTRADVQNYKTGRLEVSGGRPSL